MGMIMRGTTPSIVFDFDEDLDFEEMEQIWVTLRDGHQRVYNWPISRLTLDSERNEITLDLTQAETNCMAWGNGDVQIRFLTKTGAAFGTYKEPIDIENVIKGGIIR